MANKIIRASTEDMQRLVQKIYDRFGNVQNTADSNKVVASAGKLSTERTITLTGDASGSAAFDGSKNVSITVIVADDSHNHIITNIDGLQDALDNKLSITGTAAKATADASGQNIADTYIKSLSVSGKVITYTRGDGGTGTITTQDTNTTYSAFKGATSGAAGGSGLVPAPAAGASNRYLRSDGTWAVPPDTNTTYTLSSFGITATAAELNKLDGVTATATELNYVDGVTSNIQTQLNSKLSTTGTAAASTKLATARNINGLSFDGTANRVNYGSCSTAAGTAAKTVSCSGFALVTGAEITVKFTVTNTASNPTLNVNSTGAKAIYYRGSVISAGYLASNRTYTFRYDGSHYDLVGDVDTNTTYEAAGTSLGLVKSGGDVTISNGVITVNDDSHNHTIANIDGLQTKLNNLTLDEDGALSDTD